jgi:CheY-like chemotaxis protein
VLFPVHGDYAAGVPAATTRPGVWQTTGLALVVDDDESVRTITRRALQGMGLTVLTAEDGAEGVDVFRQHQDEIRLVILDLTMPHMSGEDAFREMRRIRGDSTIVIMSGYNEDETSQRFAGKGVSAFVQKPYEIRGLRERLRGLLEAQQPQT